MIYIFAPVRIEGGVTPPLIGRGGKGRIAESDILNSCIAAQVLIRRWKKIKLQSDIMLAQDPKAPWTEVVEAKRTIRSQHVEKHQQKIGNSGIDTKITGVSDISALTQLLESRTVSAEDVVTAYIQKWVWIST